MAAPTYNDVWTYANNLQHISQQARDAFLLAAGGVDFGDKTLAAEQLRTIVLAVTSSYGLAAKELGAQWFEFCHEKAFDRNRLAIVGEVSRYSVKSDANYHIDKMFANEITDSELISMLAGVTVNQTQKAARETILGNMLDEQREARKGRTSPFGELVKYARVPTGESCAFCIMLASRGAVYISEQSATETSEGNAYHENCNCTAVPFVEPREIIGYGEQLETFESMYRKADNMRRNFDDLPKELKERIEAAKHEHDAKYAAGLTKTPWQPMNATCIIMRELFPWLH